MPDSICDYLPWDSSFFGLRVARLAPTCLSVNNLSDALEWCRLNRIDCLYFLGVSDHSEAARLAEGANFQFVDVRVTLTRSAQRLYQKCGFATDSVMLWYNKWFRKPKLASTGDTR